MIKLQAIQLQDKCNLCLNLKIYDLILIKIYLQSNLLSKIIVIL